MLRHLGALGACILLAASGLPPASAHARPDWATDACIDALADARDALLAREGPLPAEDALALLHARANVPCGFDRLFAAPDVDATPSEATTDLCFSPGYGWSQATIDILGTPIRLMPSPVAGTMFRSPLESRISADGTYGLYSTSQPHALGAWMTIVGVPVLAPFHDAQVACGTAVNVVCASSSPSSCRAVSSPSACSASGWGRLTNAPWLFDLTVTAELERPGTCFSSVTIPSDIVFDQVPGWEWG